MRAAVIAACIFVLVANIAYTEIEQDTALQYDFYFARLEYPGIRNDSYIKNWYTDYPEADQHIDILLNRLTSIYTGHSKVQITDGIFRYPFIYIVEPAQMNATDTEILLLREYLDRGGFLLLDDIHGDEDRIPVDILLNRILPNRYFYEIDISHEIFHTVYDIDELIQVVNDGLASCEICDQWENGPTGVVPQVFGHYDLDGYINVLVMHNNDIGDAAEWLDDQNYPREMSVFAVKFLVNVAIYSLSH